MFLIVKFVFGLMLLAASTALAYAADAGGESTSGWLLAASAVSGIAAVVVVAVGVVRPFIGRHGSQPTSSLPSNAWVHGRGGGG